MTILKMRINKRGYEGTDWIKLAQERPVEQADVPVNRLGFYLEGVHFESRPRHRLF
jgi:hypothetical protein